jgi:hypothetical protein
MRLDRMLPAIGTTTMYSWHLLLKSRDADRPEGECVIANGGADSRDLPRSQRSLLFGLGCVEFAPLPAAYVVQQWIPSSYGAHCWIGGALVSIVLIFLLRKRVPDTRIEATLLSSKKHGDQ